MLHPHSSSRLKQNSHENKTGGLKIKDISECCLVRMYKAEILSVEAPWENYLVFVSKLE